MKTTVTYGYVSGALFVLTHAETEDENDKEQKIKYLELLDGMLKGKLSGNEKDLEDDHGFLGINMEKGKEARVNKTIARVTNTVCKELDLNFHLTVKFIEE